MLGCSSRWRSRSGSLPHVSSQAFADLWRQLRVRSSGCVVRSVRDGCCSLQESFVEDVQTFLLAGVSDMLRDYGYTKALTDENLVILEHSSDTALRDRQRLCDVVVVLSEVSAETAAELVDANVCDYVISARLDTPLPAVSCRFGVMHVSPHIVVRESSGGVEMFDTNWFARPSQSVSLIGARLRSSPCACGRNNAVVFLDDWRDKQFWSSRDQPVSAAFLRSVTDQLLEGMHVIRYVRNGFLELLLSARSPTKPLMDLQQSMDQIGFKLAIKTAGLNPLSPPVQD